MGHRHHVLTVFMLCLLTACTTWKAIPVNQAPYKLHRGDKVLIKTQHQGSQTIKVKSVSDTTLTDSKNRAYDFVDISRITRKQTSAVKTGTAVVGTTASVAAFTAVTTLGLVLPLLGLGVTLAVLL